MHKYFTLLIVILSITSSFGQNKNNYVSYTIKPIAINAKQIEIVFDMQLPKSNVPNSKKTSGVIDFSLQIINKKEAANPSIKGEEIAFFIEKITLADQKNKSVFLTLPNNLKLKKNLPKNNVYRLTHKDEFLLLLNPENASYEKKIPIKSKNNILSIDGNVKKSSIEITFKNRPVKTERGKHFTLQTEITRSDTIDYPAPKVKFEIHIVNIEEATTIDDVENQRFVSDSGKGITIPPGTSNYDFKLKSPEIPSKFLPKGKTYRVRLLNDSLNKVNAYPFPFELTVIKNKFEKSIFSEKTEVTISPNPVTDYLIVNSKEKSSSYKIYDISGVLVKEQKTIRRIMVSHLKPGVYLLATDSGVTRFTKK